MRFKGWVDRLWLWAVGISAAIALPLLVMMWIEDFGIFNVSLYVLLLVAIGFYRGLNGTPSSPGP